MGKTTVTNETKGKGKKKMPLIILGIILAIIVTLVILVATTASKNVKAMNHCVDAALNELKASYTVTPVDPGEFEELKIYGLMKFKVEQYDIEELGNLSIMRVNMGVMQMATFVITPQDKNMPLLSTDFMYILSNRKAYLEFYDVVEEKDEPYQQLLAALSASHADYSYLEDVAIEPTWYSSLLTAGAYKSGKSDVDQDLEQMLLDSLNIYLTHSKQLPFLTEEEKATKLAITTEYSDGLIEKGGISTDVFKDSLGKEQTKKFFDNVFFGTKAK